MTYLSLSTFPTFSFSQMTHNVYLLSTLPLSLWIFRGTSRPLVHGVTNGAWLSMNPSVLMSVFSPTQTLYILHTPLKTFLSPFLIPIKILESSCLVISPGMTIIVSLLQEHTNPLVSLEEPLPPILYLQKGSYFFPLFILNYHTVPLSGDLIYLNTLSY